MNVNTPTDYAIACRQIQKAYSRGCREVAKHWLELSDRDHLSPEFRRFALDRAIDNYNTAQALEAA